MNDKELINELNEIDRIKKDIIDICSNMDKSIADKFLLVVVVSHQCYILITGIDHLIGTKKYLMNYMI